MLKQKLVGLTEDQWRWLEAKAKREVMPISVIIRLALTAMIAAETAPRRPKKG